MAPDSTLSIGDAATLLRLSSSRVRQLTDNGVLSAHRTPGGHRRYDRDTLLREWRRWRSADNEGDPPNWRHTYPLPDLREDDVWRDVRQQLEDRTHVPERARHILAYAVTEMVNNAIDHSAGRTVDIALSLRERSAVIAIADDGMGAFANLSERLGLGGVEAAVVEITKGKRTTMPDQHTGEGIFFTSKAVDVFSITANGFSVVFDNVVADVAFGASSRHGTTVVLTLDLDTARVLADVFGAYTDDAGRFDRTTPRIELVSMEGEFISRSEAKRFAAGLEKFTRVELDFTGVPMVGQGFADELFRVWHRQHPDIRLDVIGANRGVALMINRVER
ncbi:MAG: DUF4325 domain-containing protein [Microbacterium sp.]|uniref:STAS-like domain-containing protein n=1 Tax=Microbacterium sp. TaxID=51671 RepID=UPI0039E5BAC4